MLVNRAFQGSGATIGAIAGVPGTDVQTSENPILPFGPVSTGWRGIGGVDLSLTLLHPLSPNLPVVGVYLNIFDYHILLTYSIGSRDDCA